MGFLEAIEIPHYIRPIYTPDRPSSIILELTYACNEACKHCLRSAGREIEEEINFKEIKPLLIEMAQLEIDLLTITGGEPLTKLDLVLKIATLAQDLGIETALLTNGTLIDGRVAKLLKAAGIKDVQVSLDGVDERDHDNHRNRVGAYKETLQGIKFLKEADIEVAVATVVTRETFKRLDEIIKRAQELGVRPRVSPVMPFGRGRNSELLLTPAQYLEYHLLTHTILGTNQLSATVFPRERCSVGTAPVITPNGDIYPCMHLVFDEFRIGNIKKNSLKELWTHSPILKKLMSITKEDIEGCKTCWNRLFCNSCRGVAYVYHGTIYKPDSYRCLANRLFVQLGFPKHTSAGKIEVWEGSQKWMLRRKSLVTG